MYLQVSLTKMQHLSLHHLNTFPILFISDIVPVGIIAGGTVGSCLLLLLCLFAFAFFIYRQRKGSK